MAGTHLCDHCGREFAEEDLRSGRAMRHQGDVFCAECAAIYAADAEHGGKGALEVEEATEAFRRLPRGTRVIVAAAGP